MRWSTQVLIFTRYYCPHFFYCLIYHSNPTKLNARSVLYPCVFCIEQLTNELQGNVTSYVLAQGIKLDFGFGAHCLTVLMK